MKLSTNEALRGLNLLRIDVCSTKQEMKEEVVKWLSVQEDPIGPVDLFILIDSVFENATSSAYNSMIETGMFAYWAKKRIAIEPSEEEAQEV